MAVILTQRAEEGKTFTVTAAFKDPSSGDAVTPNSPLTWTLTDGAGQIVNNREDVSVVPATSIQVVFSGDDLVVNTTYDNIRRWYFTGTFDGVDGNDLPLDSVAIWEIIPSSSGEGTGTYGTHPNLYQTYITLPDYWDFLQINECAAWGIRNYPNESTVSYGCGKYWNQDARYWLSAAISKVENRLESDRWLGFPLKRKYYGTTQLDYKFPAYLGKHLRSVGLHKTTAVELSHNISLSCDTGIYDPVTLQFTVDFSSKQEILVCFPGTIFPITPSFVNISGTIATVKIPRCRLLKPKYHIDYQNDTDRPNYETDSNFLSEVDIYRDYVDSSTGNNLVWWKHKGQLYCQNGVFTCNPSGACSDVKQLACPYISNQRLGAVQFEPATYSSGSYSKSSYAVKRRPDGIETNYMRGYYDRYEEISADLKRAIVALTHNNLPRKWCSCDQQSLYYDDDTRPLEPAVRLKSGRSTWGLYEAEQIIREFDADRYSHKGGLF